MSSDLAAISVYRRGDAIIVVPSWRGVQEVPPAECVGIGPDEVQRAIERATLVCQRQPSHLPPAPNPPAAWVAAGVTSERMFNSDLARCKVVVRSGHWHVEPWVPKGAGFGLLSTVDVASIEAAVDVALSWLESAPRHPARPRARSAGNRSVRGE